MDDIVQTTPPNTISTVPSGGRAKGLVLAFLSICALVAAYYGLLVFAGVDLKHGNAPEIQKTLTRYRDVFIPGVFGLISLIFILSWRETQRGTSRRAFFQLCTVTSIGLFLLQPLGIPLLSLLFSFLPLGPWAGALIAISPIPLVALGVLGIIFALVISLVLTRSNRGWLFLVIFMAILFSWQSVKAVQTFRIYQADVKRIEAKIQASPAYACITKASKEEWQKCAFDTVISETELSNCSLSSFDNPLYYYEDEAQNICRLAYDINKGKVDVQTCLHFDNDQDQFVQDRCFDKLISQLTSEDSGSFCDQFYPRDIYPKYQHYHLRCVERLISVYRQNGKPDQTIKGSVCSSITNLDYAVADSQIKNSLQQLCPTVSIRNINVVWPKELFTSTSRVSMSWDTDVPATSRIEVETGSYKGPIILNDTEYKKRHDISFIFDDTFGASVFNYTISACNNAPTPVCGKLVNRADYCSQSSYCK